MKKILFTLLIQVIGINQFYAQLSSASSVCAFADIEGEYAGEIVENFTSYEARVKLFCADFPVLEVVYDGDLFCSGTWTFQEEQGGVFFFREDITNNPNDQCSTLVYITLTPQEPGVVNIGYALSDTYSPILANADVNKVGEAPSSEPLPLFGKKHSFLFMLVMITVGSLILFRRNW